MRCLACGGALVKWTKSPAGAWKWGGHRWTHTRKPRRAHDAVPVPSEWRLLAGSEIKHPVALLGEAAEAIRKAGLQRVSLNRIIVEVCGGHVVAVGRVVHELGSALHRKE